MTPEEEERELEKFTAALHGDGGQNSAAAKLGEKLRRRRAEALAGRDETGEMRVWKAIDTKLGPAPQARPARTFEQRMRFAQAAGLFAIGIAAGWFLRPTEGTRLTDSQLEFSYGDFERPRGSLSEKIVSSATPADSLRSLTDALIGDAVPFELYSLGGSDDRRLLFTVPPGDAPRTSQVLRELKVDFAPGQTLSLTFAGASPAR
jgi:hypothetical protein